MATTQITTEAVTEYLRKHGFGLATWDEFNQGQGHGVDPGRVLIVDDLSENDAKRIARSCGLRRVSQKHVDKVRECIVQIHAELSVAEEEAEKAADQPDAYEQGEPKPEKSLKGTMAGYRERYGKEASCGDEIAQALAGIKGDDLANLAERNDINLLERWGHLNPGQQRMCLGNVLRTRVRRGEKIAL